MAWVDAAVMPLSRIFEHWGRYPRLVPNPLRSRAEQAQWFHQVFIHVKRAAMLLIWRVRRCSAKSMAGGMTQTVDEEKTT